MTYDIDDGGCQRRVGNSRRASRVNLSGFRNMQVSASFRNFIPAGTRMSKRKQTRIDGAVFAHGFPVIKIGVGFGKRLSATIAHARFSLCRTGLVRTGLVRAHESLSPFSTDAFSHGHLLLSLRRIKFYSKIVGWALPTKTNDNASLPFWNSNGGRCPPYWLIVTGRHFTKKQGFRPYEFRTHVSNVR